MMSRTVVLGMLRRRAISAIDKPQTRFMDRRKHTSSSSSCVDPLTAPMRALADDERETGQSEPEGSEVEPRDPVSDGGSEEEADEGCDPEGEVKSHTSCDTR